MKKNFALTSLGERKRTFSAPQTHSWCDVDILYDMRANKREPTGFYDKILFVYFRSECAAERFGFEIKIFILFRKVSIERRHKSFRKNFLYQFKSFQAIVINYSVEVL